MWVHRAQVEVLTNTRSRIWQPKHESRRAYWKTPSLSQCRSSIKDSLVSRVTRATDTRICCLNSKSNKSLSTLFDENYTLLHLSWVGKTILQLSTSSSAQSRILWNNFFLFHSSEVHNDRFYLSCHFIVSAVSQFPSSMIWSLSFWMRNKKSTDQRYIQHNNEIHKLLATWQKDQKRQKIET